MILRTTLYLSLLFAAFTAKAAETQSLSPNNRHIPGTTATPHLLYKHTGSRDVKIAGSWDAWAKKHPLTSRQGQWFLDISQWKLKPSRYEFKFIIDNQYESGVNRILFINEKHLIERPPALIDQALITSPTSGIVHLKKPIDPNTFTFKIHPNIGIDIWHIKKGEQTRELIGYDLHSGHVTFIFDERTYQRKLSPDTQVHIAGNFNGWNPSANGFRMSDEDHDRIWECTVPYNSLRPEPKNAPLLFKFTLNRSDWLDVPKNARNATGESGNGNLNLKLDPQLSAGQALHFTTRKPFDLSQQYQLTFDGLWKKPLH